MHNLSQQAATLICFSWRKHHIHKNASDLSELGEQALWTADVFLITFVGHPAFMCDVWVRNDSVCDNHHHHARHQIDTISTDTTLTILTLSSHPQHQHWHHPQNTNTDAIPTISAWTPHPWHQPPPAPPRKKEKKKNSALKPAARDQHWCNLHNNSTNIICTTWPLMSTSQSAKHQHWHHFNNCQHQHYITGALTLWLWH